LSNQGAICKLILKWALEKCVSQGSHKCHCCFFFFISDILLISWPSG